MALKYINQPPYDKVFYWVNKGKQVGAPQYTVTFDIYYPTLLLFEGSCSYNIGNYEASYTSFKLAKSELQKIPSDSYNLFTDNVKTIKDIHNEVINGLNALTDKVVKEDSYITNKGLFQKWIAKVIERSKNVIEVRITYVNSEVNTGLRKGSVVKFTLNEVKLLKSVSLDAGLKGWR